MTGQAMARFIASFIWLGSWRRDQPSNGANVEINNLDGRRSLGDLPLRAVLDLITNCVFIKWLYFLDMQLLCASAAAWLCARVRRRRGPAHAWVGRGTHGAACTAGVEDGPRVCGVGTGPGGRGFGRRREASTDLVMQVVSFVIHNVRPADHLSIVSFSNARPACSVSRA